ncbi:hypothetical protein H696_05303 [Fonticula alba]|uniref:EGF-like domain-containing protein n=1 Tax=Fonticula alba TaxID=691883 RepID=A0A058Z4D9_FONAL|nr:hypothetical protein H696_05303 [Fonticula alba]KCV68387.1 hypothetical protein H696_05303 [Fonticula alba]|eukprot:XP_009497441.1 hypothetical protein H696_05303 [Fonticula alba]
MANSVMRRWAWSWAALALVLGLLGRSLGQDIHLLAASRPSMALDRAVSFVPVGSDNSAVLYRESGSQFRTHSSVWPPGQALESRWGPFFRENYQARNSPWPDTPLSTTILLALHPTSLPTLVEQNANKVGLFQALSRHGLPEPQAELLAAVDSPPGGVELLGLTGEPGSERGIFLARLTSSDLVQRPHTLRPATGQVLVTSGFGRSFYLVDDGGLRRVTIGPDDNVQCLTIPSSGRVLQLEATRLSGSSGVEGDAADVAMLLEDGEVRVYLRLGDPSGVVLSGGQLPAGVSAHGARLLVAPASASRDYHSPMYLLNPAASTLEDRVWYISIAGQALTWQRAILPPAAGSPSTLQLVLSNVEAPLDRWHLVDSNHRLLFDPAFFRCSEDPSIVCDRDGSRTGSDLGWRCASERVESPLVSLERLCAGCPDGWYLDRPTAGSPFAHPDHACRPCAEARCRTCGPTHCFVCAEPYLLEPSGPGGVFTCVEGCSSGYRHVGGMCLPSSRPLPLAGISTPVTRDLGVELAPGDRITAVGRTWLSADPHSEQVILPASTSGPATGVLIFTEHPRAYIQTMDALTGRGQSPARQVPLLGGAFSAPVLGFAEMGPFRRDGQLVYVLVAALQGGQASRLELSCSGTGPCPAGANASLTPVSTESSNMVWRFDEDLLAISKGPRGVLLYRPDPSYRGVIYHHNLAAGVASLRSGPALDRAPLAAGNHWMVASGAGSKPSAFPIAMGEASGFQWPPLAGRLLSGLPDSDTDMVPVMLARDLDAWVPGELVFSNTLGPRWEVLHVPGDMVPAGRAVDLPFVRRALGTFPRALEPATAEHGNVLLQAIDLPGANGRYPSGLLLLSRTFIGLSLLHCPSGSAGPCALLPATFVDLPPALRLPPGTLFWNPATVHVPAVAAGSMRTEADPAPVEVSFLIFAPAVGPVALALTVACPGGGHGPMCDGCHPRCAVCGGPANAGDCVTCVSGAWLHGRSCVTECPAGTWPDVQACQACPADCASCTSGTECTRCMAGHFRTGQLTCQACDESCASCTGADGCDTCQPGLVFMGLDPGVPSLCGSACRPGEHVADGRCAECHASCELCFGAAASCQVCAEGFRWASRPAPGGTGACVPCGPGCASCTATKCLACEAGLFLAPDGACEGTCPAGTWPNGESCQPCDLSCAACAGGQSTDCVGCPPGLELLDAGMPPVGSCVSGCAAGQYRDPGSDACLACDRACAACNGPSDGDCWRCADGVLQDGDCVQVCASDHVAVAGRCLPCHASCGECSGVRSTECSTCQAGLLALVTGPGSMRCVPACPAAYHASSTACTPCPLRCASCPDAASTCGQCERGWLLAGAACVQTCPADRLALGHECVACHSACDWCFGPRADQCLACEAATPFLVDGRCVGVCPEGTFADRNTCMPCGATCASWALASECTSCAGDRALLGVSVGPAARRGTLPRPMCASAAGPSVPRAKGRMPAPAASTAWSFSRMGAALRSARQAGRPAATRAGVWPARSPVPSAWHMGRNAGSSARRVGRAMFWGREPAGWPARRGSSCRKAGRSAGSAPRRAAPASARPTGAPGVCRGFSGRVRECVRRAVALPRGPSRGFV